MKAQELLERFRPQILSSLAAAGRRPVTLRLECLTARRRASDGQLLGYDLNVLLDPTMGVPVEDPQARPGWYASSAYVMLVDEDLQIPVREDCDDATVIAAVLAAARAGVAADEAPQLQSCQRLVGARSARPIGYAATVRVGSVARTIVVDPDGARFQLERVGLD